MSYSLFGSEKLGPLIREFLERGSLSKKERAQVISSETEAVRTLQNIEGIGDFNRRPEEWFFQSLDDLPDILVGAPGFSFRQQFERLGKKAIRVSHERTSSLEQLNPGAVEFVSSHYVCDARTKVASSLHVVVNVPVLVGGKKYKREYLTLFCPTWPTSGASLAVSMYSQFSVQQFVNATKFRVCPIGERGEEKEFECTYFGKVLINCGEDEQYSTHLFHGIRATDLTRVYEVERASEKVAVAPKR